MWKAIAFENEEEQNGRTLETLPDSEDFKMRSDESSRGDQNSSSEPEKLDSTKDSERLENIQSKSYQRKKRLLTRLTFRKLRQRVYRLDFFVSEGVC